MDSLKELGLGAAVAIIILREVFTFIRSMNGPKNGKAGDKDPSYWLLEFRKIVKEEIADNERRHER